MNTFLSFHLSSPGLVLSVLRRRHGDDLLGRLQNEEGRLAAVSEQEFDTSPSSPERSRSRRASRVPRRSSASVQFSLIVRLCLARSSVRHHLRVLSPSRPDSRRWRSRQVPLPPCPPLPLRRPDSLAPLLGHARELHRPLLYSDSDSRGLSIRPRSGCSPPALGRHDGGPQKMSLSLSTADDMTRTLLPFAAGLPFKRTAAAAAAAAEPRPSPPVSRASFAIEGRHSSSVGPSSAARCSDGLSRGFAKRQGHVVKRPIDPQAQGPQAAIWPRPCLVCFWSNEETRRRVPFPHEVSDRCQLKRRWMAEWWGGRREGEPPHTAHRGPGFGY